MILSDCENEETQSCVSGSAMPARQSWFVAKCRTSRGSNFDLPVLDLSAGGILVETGFRAFNVGERVLVRLPNLSAIPAEVVWIEENTGGIAFEQLLHESVLEHLMASGACRT
jgi:hypothetical protein